MGPYEFPVAGTTPGTPTSLTATAASSSLVNLVWVPHSSGGQTGFRIERKVGTGAYSLLANKAANDTTHPDNTVSANTTYTYQIFATNSVGSSTPPRVSNSVLTPGGSPVVFDANALTISASSGETSSPVNFTGASNGNFLLYPSNQINDFVSFNVNVPVANIPYAISVKYHENDYRGIVQLLIDGSNQGSAFDAHKENPAVLTTVALGSKTFTTTGNHTFRFQITNKNAGSQGFQIGLDTITLTP